MDIKKSIENLALKRGRATAKTDAIYDSEREARDAESSASEAKDAKVFDKFKKQCLTSVDAGEKATKAWHEEWDDWETCIMGLGSEIAAEKGKITQQQKEADAVSKAIDEINAQIQAYNDSLPLGSHDQRPLILKKNSGAILLNALAALDEATALVKSEMTAWTNQQEWTSKPIKELKTIKDRVSKSKFTKPSK
jgi:hypothetical protein